MKRWKLSISSNFTNTLWSMSFCIDTNSNIACSQSPSIYGQNFGCNGLKNNFRHFYKNALWPKLATFSDMHFCPFQAQQTAHSTLNIRNFDMLPNVRSFLESTSLIIWSTCFKAKIGKYLCRNAMCFPTWERMYPTKISMYCILWKFCIRPE